MMKHSFQLQAQVGVGSEHIQRLSELSRCLPSMLVHFVCDFSNSVKCPCNVNHDSVTLIFTFLIITSRVRRNEANSDIDTGYTNVVAVALAKTAANYFVILISM